MRNNPIDKLFKNKLENFELAPKPVAWDKIQKGLKKEPKRTNVGLKVAAIFILLALSAAVLFERNHIMFSNNNEISEVVPPDLKKGENLTIKSTERPIERPSSNIPEKIASIKSNSAVASSNAKAPVIKEKKNFKSLPLEEKTKSNAIEKIAQDSKLLIAENTTKKETEVAAVPAKKEMPTITIEFKSGKTRNPSALAANNVEKERPIVFSIKKVIEKVKDVEIGLAQVREAKDELFTLNNYISNNNSKTLKQ